MSIQGSGTRDAELEPDVSMEVDRIEDLVQVFFVAATTLDFTAAQGTNLPADGQGGGDLIVKQADALVGHLKDNHVAELVAFQRHSALAHIEKVSGEGTTPGSARVEYQVNKRPDQQIERIREDNIGDNPGARGDLSNDEFEPSQITPFANIMIGIDTMDFTTLSVGQGFNDTVNGTGGGELAVQADTFFINYRNEFGRGPIFEDDEALQLGFGIKWNQIENEKIRLEYHFSAIFDVFKERRPEGAEYEDVSGLG